MFGRLLGYLGPLWLEEKPSRERGDRFEIGAVVVNLTGLGNCSRLSSWPSAGVEIAGTKSGTLLGRGRTEVDPIVWTKNRHSFATSPVANKYRPATAMRSHPGRQRGLLLDRR
jgi:hypothetical protein